MKPIRPPGSSYPNIFIAIRLTIPIYKYRLRWSPFLAFRTKNGPPQSRERNSPIRPGGQGGTLTPSAQSGLFTVRPNRRRSRRSRPSRGLRPRHLPRGLAPRPGWGVESYPPFTLDGGHIYPTTPVLYWAGFNTSNHHITKILLTHISVSSLVSQRISSSKRPKFTLP